MSEPDSIEKSVTGIIADVLGVDPGDIAPDTALAGIGWDSMNSMESLVRLESTFGISLDLRSFNAARTVTEMMALVEKLRVGVSRRP
jgi:acyl carrier protein